MSAVPDPTVEARIAEVLGEHRYEFNERRTHGWCSCGARWFPTQKDHNAHVARILAEHTERAVKEALEARKAAEWPDLLADKVFQDALLATAGLMETQRISPECRTNRTVDGAWDEAVRRLREIYDAQVEHDPTLTLGLSIGRIVSPAPVPHPAAADPSDGGA